MQIIVYVGVAVFIAIFAAIIILIAVPAKRARYGEPESPSKRAGRRGETAARGMIKSVLREDDMLFGNITVSFEGKEAELDNVVVNRCGVFIIEVKNYSGKLYGSETDFSWEKYHVSDGGNIYEKTVRNPIRQVNRQTYILSHWLRERNVEVWVDGYSFLCGGNSPVKSPAVLLDRGDIDRAIHTFRKKGLGAKTVAEVGRLLSSETGHEPAGMYYAKR